MKMKRLIVAMALIGVLAVVAGAAFIAWPPQSMDVTTTSKMILPPVGLDPSDLGSWTTATAYVYGDFVTNGNSRLMYWCTVAGTSTNVASGGPTHTDGDATDGPVTWRHIVKERNQLIIVNDGSFPLYLGFGHAAEANKGIRLNANGGTFNAFDNFGYIPKCAVYGVTASGTNNVCIQEM